jgi:hypothetical protein
MVGASWVRAAATACDPCSDQARGDARADEARAQDRPRAAGLAYLETCKVCATHEPSTGCVHCTRDHGMKAEPSLVAGITSAPQGGRARRTTAAFVRADEIGRET